MSVSPYTPLAHFTADFFQFSNTIVKIFWPAAGLVIYNIALIYVW